MRSTLNEAHLKDKCTKDDSDPILRESDRGMQFCQNNAEGEADEFDTKRKEIEGKYNSIMSRVYRP